ncbi:MAG: bifunctional demethylmenaquinone methyltransferase/2-methoxy-6-polyprenyl-1,4-benzoquinol methylase UbiE [Gammaproteobacteria bacterium]|jgi:demethylmenaquinone methyltransferase/2-methoxy-6-polyprenyl-1,4-benzoquinol methylase|nr:bifunctional demethylmenaquinone methyltransferase/2-methoxy-6-polyprenyl-1,4-benzoquinol methylase UbiE [Gammaproteobacteria bacterium]
MATTHFGFEQVPEEDKARRVGQVFDSVASRYDLMNDLMSLGLHRLWKRYAIGVSGVREGQQVLDLAGGTGDLAALLAGRVGPSGSVVVADINRSMLEVGRERLDDRGLVGNLRYAQANAERLPFADARFDCVTMAFGLRNVTHKSAALASILRVLKPGGKLLVLEFSQVTVGALKPLYDLYSFRALPLLGRLVAGDSESYRYLAESIRMHPDQETLKGMMQAAGFVRCDYLNLTGGVVALHRGWKP